MSDSRQKKLIANNNFYIKLDLLDVRDSYMQHLENEQKKLLKKIFISELNAELSKKTKSNALDKVHLEEIKSYIHDLKSIEIQNRPFQTVFEDYCRHCAAHIPWELNKTKIELSMYAVTKKKEIIHSLFEPLRKNDDDLETKLEDFKKAYKTTRTKIVESRSTNPFMIKIHSILNRFGLGNLMVTGAKASKNIDRTLSRVKFSLYSNEQKPTTAKLGETDSTIKNSDSSSEEKATYKKK
jgi:hypothetical protein